MHKISYGLVIRKNRCQRDAITCVYILSYHALSYPHYILNVYRIHSSLSGKANLLVLISSSQIRIALTQIPCGKKLTFDIAFDFIL